MKTLDRFLPRACLFAAVMCLALAGGCTTWPLVVPPGPVTNALPPVVTGEYWRGAWFCRAWAGAPFQNTLGGVAYTSSLEFGAHGYSGEDTYRENMLAAQGEAGADTLVLLAETAGGQHGKIMLGATGEGYDVLRMAVLGSPSPKDGHYFPADSNAERSWPAFAEKHYGIKRMVLILFNDSSSIAKGNREAHVKKMCAALAYRAADRAAFLISLEASEFLSVAEVTQIAGWVAQYGGGKRCIVGSSYPGILQYKSVPGVELWVENRNNPPAWAGSTAQFVADLKDVQAQSGKPVWAGEYYLDPTAAECKALTKQLATIKPPLAGIMNGWFR